MSPTAAASAPPRACSLPAGSRIAALAEGADFADCYEMQDARPDGSAAQACHRLMRTTPAWMHALMRLRNAVVRHWGLKDLGRMDGGLAVAERLPPLQAGDRMGLFRVLSVSPDEIVLTETDRHLDVWVACTKHPASPQQPALWRVSTVVRIHNRLGRAYMAVVVPFHRRIVPALLRRAA